MHTSTSNEYLRYLPSIDAVMRRPDVDALCRKFSRSITIKAVRLILNDRRMKILSSTEHCQTKNDASSEITSSEIVTIIADILKPSLRNVINATGIIIHTNLGRAPLVNEAIESIIEVARSYSNLEYDIKRGERIARSEHIEELLKQISGAEGGFVVNNNAAAILLCLNTLARGREVIISRGELIEIGGSFRIPEILEQSGAVLIEVGTTNRTHVQDYRHAVTGQTALLMRAHTSNYRILGFTSEVELSELCRLGQELNIPVVFDMGSGNLLDFGKFGLQGESTIQDAVKSGVDVITFSGDKLLGGPQAGIIVGKHKYIHKMKSNPLARALRIDKLTLAGLEATLQLYAYMPEQIHKIPVLKMFMTPESTLKRKAQTLVRTIKQEVPAIDTQIIKETSQVGGGAYPMYNLPTWAVALNPSPLSVNAFEALLRSSSTPIIARISKDRIVFDMRTLFPKELPIVAGAIIAILRKHNIDSDNMQNI